MNASNQAFFAETGRPFGHWRGKAALILTEMQLVNEGDGGGNVTNNYKNRTHIKNNGQMKEHTHF